MVEEQEPGEHGVWEAPVQGHSLEWGLCVDGRLVASTEDPMTAELAQHWARRVLGEHVTFERGHVDGGYWVANPATSSVRFRSAARDPQECAR